MTMRSSTVIAVLAMTGCGQPAEPFGKLPRSKLSDWARDCNSEIVEEPAIKGKDPTMVGKRWREATFQNATHRFACKPPGWAIYVSANDRVVGLCVDNKLRPDPIEDYFTRARRLVGTHWGVDLAADITKDKCLFEPETVAHGLLRWEQGLPDVVNPDGSMSYHPNVGSLWACCWEVKD